MTRHLGHIFMTATLILASASLSLGATVSVNPTGTSSNGVYTVQGSDMDGVAGFDLVLKYDSPALASPTVSQGSLISGAIMVANTNAAGTIRIAVVSNKSFSGSGPLVTIKFTTHTGGTVSVASFNPINSSGATVSGGTTTDTPTTDTTNTGTTTTGTTTTGTTTTGTTTTGSTTAGSTTAGTTTTSSSGATYLGTVTMPSDSQIKGETKTTAAGETPVQPSTPEVAAKPGETPPAGEAPPAGETPAATKVPTATKKAETINVASNTAVLERFRAYRGDKTPAIMVALFKQQISPSFRQKPFVALSDGTTTVTIVADLSAETGSSPNFALTGAKMVSLKKDDASSTWLIKALPAKGALSASLMVLNETKVTEYPLTIAPAIKKAAATEKEFAAFLKDAAKTPAKHDLNGDGTYDGIDDYIYTANYLVRQQKARTTAK
ncbi:hypothetical protein F6V25_07190 [Oryzomonas japonica]|uniref:Cohesin domain-containing protein n=1 Tax=Oryzomonas japonica TaxID=2603858 RepID=A0A7J4ZSJ3_9BACT|nr:cohesin domain-containing protein [Oryzomonas japonica]KAB0666247.1 hypothetical protein F6V25_07190 [Oryzomonas japonica]